MDSLNIITLTNSNIDSEHICCALSDKKCLNGVKAKKEWLKDRFKDGLIFKKFDVRQKVFIEYIPADNAWCPIEAPGYMFINCFWVAGSYKGKGYGSKLLDECFKDSEGMNGVVVLTSKTKKPYMSDKTFFIKKGFSVCDTASPYFELLVKKFRNEAPDPVFKKCVKESKINNNIMTIYYTEQCPFTDYYIGEIVKRAESIGFPLEIKKIQSKEEAQNAPSPYTTYSVFYNGQFLTHEILNEKKFDKLVEKIKMG